MTSDDFSSIIRKCYLQLLNREPDDLGLQYYLGLMENGLLTEPKLMEIIKNSSEYKILNIKKQTLSESSDKKFSEYYSPKDSEYQKKSFSIKELEKYRKNLDLLDISLPEPKIVALYRIKNEERWIEKSLKSASEICKEIVVLDDGSTDDTLRICKKFNTVVDILHQSNLPYDHIRDYNVLLDMAMKRNPDFIIYLAGDEIFVPNMKKILFEEISILYPEATIFSFQFLYMFDKPNQYRVDGVYNNIWDKRLMRITEQNKKLRHKRIHSERTHHAGLLPDDVSSPVLSQVKILHYGNYDQKLRNEKYEFWNKLDPNNSYYDGYKHIKSADTKFSGKKIELETLHDGMFVKDII